MKKQITILIIFVVLLLFYSCEVPDAGILYSIEQERKIDDNNLSNLLTAGQILAKDVDATAGDDFLLASGTIYNVDASDNAQYSIDGSTGTWGKDYNNVGDKLCYRIFDLGGTEYAVLYDKNQPDEILVDSHLYSHDGTSWQIVTTGVMETLTIEDGDVADGVFYFTYYVLESDNSRTYSLGAFDGVTVTEDVASVTGISVSTYFDAASDGGTTYIIYGNRIFSGVDAASMTEIPDTDASLADIKSSLGLPSDDSSFRGIHYSSIYSRFFLSTKDGSIWYLDGGVWKINNKISDQPFDFEDFSFDGQDLLLVGSEDGYYEKSGALATAEFLRPTISTDEDNYLTLDLRLAVVNSLFAHDEAPSDGTDEVLFALTSGNGLWSNRADSQGNRVWNQE